MRTPLGVPTSQTAFALTVAFPIDRFRPRSISHVPLRTSVSADETSLSTLEQQNPPLVPPQEQELQAVVQEARKSMEAEAQEQAPQEVETQSGTPPLSRSTTMMPSPNDDDDRLAESAAAFAVLSAASPSGTPAKAVVDEAKCGSCSDGGGGAQSAAGEDTIGEVSSVIADDRPNLSLLHACTHCRASKTACADERPCARCRRLGLECSTDDGQPRKRACKSCHAAKVACGTLFTEKCNRCRRLGLECVPRDPPGQPGQRRRRQRSSRNMAADAAAAAGATSMLLESAAYADAGMHSRAQMASAMQMASRPSMLQQPIAMYPSNTYPQLPSVTGVANVGSVGSVTSMTNSQPTGHAGTLLPQLRSNVGPQLTAPSLPHGSLQDAPAIAPVHSSGFGSAGYVSSSGMGGAQPLQPFPHLSMTAPGAGCSTSIAGAPHAGASPRTKQSIENVAASLLDLSGSRENLMALAEDTPAPPVHPVSAPKPSGMHNNNLNIMGSMQQQQKMNASMPYQMQQPLQQQPLQQQPLQQQPYQQQPYQQQPYQQQPFQQPPLQQPPLQQPPLQQPPLQQLPLQQPLPQQPQHSMGMVPTSSLGGLGMLSASSMPSSMPSPMPPGGLPSGGVPASLPAGFNPMAPPLGTSAMPTSMPLAAPPMRTASSNGFDGTGNMASLADKIFPRA